MWISNGEISNNKIANVILPQRLRRSIRKILSVGQQTKDQGRVIKSRQRLLFYISFIQLILTAENVSILAMVM